MVASAEGASSPPLSPRFGIATESVSGSGLAPALDSVAVFTLVTSSPDLAPGTVEESGSVAASDPGAVFTLVTSPPDLAGDTVEESGSVAVSDPGAVFSLVTSPPDLAPDTVDESGLWRPPTQWPLGRASRPSGGLLSQAIGIRSGTSDWLRNRLPAELD